MRKQTEFKIENNTSETISVAIEPEGMIVTLSSDEVLVITDDYLVHPPTVSLSEGPNGEMIPCIWPGDGNTIVKLNGKNVLDG